MHPRIRCRVVCRRPRPAAHAVAMEPRQRAEVVVPVTPDVVRALFDARPARWLKPFLALAAHCGTGQASTGAAPSSFRLGRPVDTDDGEVSVDLTWWPHQQSGLFESFRGRFVLRADGDQTQLCLEGRAVAGSPTRNAAVIDALPALLARALSADRDQELVG